jgi:hypothetical protein
MSLSIDTAFLNPKEFPDAIQVNLGILAKRFTEADEMLPKLSAKQLAEFLHSSENPTSVQAEGEYLSLRREGSDVKEYWSDRQKIENLRAKALQLLQERIAKLEAERLPKERVEGVQQQTGERANETLEGVVTDGWSV